MKRFLLSLLLIFSALGYAQAELLSPDKAFSFKAKVIDNEIRLSWNIAKGYYLYKEKIEISANLPARLGKAIFPPAKIKNDAFFGVVGTYRKNVVVRLPILSGVEKSILLSVSYQGCADIGVCYPPIKKTHTLAINSTQRTPIETALNPLSSTQNQALPMFDSANDGPLPPDEAFKLTVLTTNANTLKAIWEIKPDYYLYHDKFFIDVQGAELAKFNLPKGKIKEDALFGRVETHKGRLEVDIVLKNIQTNKINLTLGYQGCWEGGVCYPPQEKVLSLSLSDTTEIEQPNQNTTPPDIQTELSETQEIIKSIQSKGFYSLLFFFFIAGLGAAFTSCILPMIPIVSAIIIGQEQKVSTKRAFAMSLVFVVFMSLAYALIGLLFAKSGEQIQIVLQNPWALGSFSLLFVLLAFSMFGYFEIKIPNFIQNKVANMSNKQKGGSFVGVAVMGFLSALIVGPCSAPILSAALLYIAQSDANSALLGASALFALGMGMGMPLVVAGTGASMPKPGVWMNNVKYLFGVIMLGMAIYFIERVIPPNITLILWALLFTISPIALGVLNPQTSDSTPWQRIFKAVGLIMLGYGMLLMLLVARGGGDMFAPLAGYGASNVQVERAHVKFAPIKSMADLEQILAQSKQAKQSVVLDFYADWCIACKELERFVFSNTQVVEKMQNVIALQADVTKNDAIDKALMKHFNIIGPPAILFFNNGVEKRSQRIIGETNAEGFIQRLHKTQ